MKQTYNTIVISHCIIWLLET